MPEGEIQVPKIQTFGPYQKSLSANPTKAKVTLDTDTISDINNFAFALGTSEYIDGIPTWEDATHDSLLTFASVQGKYVWLMTIGMGDNITVPDRGLADTPIKVEVV